MFNFFLKDGIHFFLTRLIIITNIGQRLICNFNMFAVQWIPVQAQVVQSFQVIIQVKLIHNRRTDPSVD